MAILATAIANYARKKAIPFFKFVKKCIGIIEKLEKLENKNAISESNFRAFMNILKTPIFITNLKGEVTYVNRAWLRFTGLQFSDSMGFSYLSVIPLAVSTDDKYQEKIEKLINRLILHPSSWEGEIIFQPKGTAELIKTICRTELIYDENKEQVETIWSLDIIK